MLATHPPTQTTSVYFTLEDSKCRKKMQPSIGPHGAFEAGVGGKTSAISSTLSPLRIN